MRPLARRSARIRLALTYAAILLAMGAVLLVALVLTAKLSAPIVHVTATAHPQPAPAAPPVPPAPRAPGAPPVARLRVSPGTSFVRQQRAADISRLLLIGGILLALTALAALPLGWFASGRMLRPVRQITARARTISAGNLHERLAITGERDEFTELGDTLDDLLARLQAAFDAQRRFVANASHELRTPLTLERTLLQVALADPNASAETLRATCEELLVAGQDQERLIEALLTLASSERGLERREPTDLGVLAARVLERPLPELEQHHIQLETQLDPAVAEGDPALIERLISNLVDNAVRHNVAGGRVEVITRQDGDRAVLVVENSGQLISPEEIDTMFEPFRRLGPARIGPEEGQHGLGLSIVRAIADAHGAELIARPRPGGGLTVRVAFAAVPPPQLG